MEKVLITGAAGFLGSHLCEKFISEGFAVLGIDNLITGNMKNIESLEKSPNFKFLKHDIIKPLENEINLNIDLELDFDLILHFACPASPQDYLKYPLETLKANSIGTFNTLELAESCNARYIFASSSEVYGDPLIHPQKEDYWGNVNPNGPRSVYDEAKRFSESLSIAYSQKGVDVRIARIFNVYGPRMKVNDGRVVPNFILQALKSKDLTIYGDGNQTRSFCYVSDLVEGIWKLSLKENITGEIFNLGNPEEHAIQELAKMIINKTSSSSRPVYKQLPEDDPRRRCPDIKKAKTILNWEAKISLDHGLENTINYFKSLN